MTAAAIRKWSHPLSREAAVLADVFDLEYAKSGAKNRKPYARPWDDIAKRTRRGNAAGRTGAQVVALLRPTSVS